MAETNGKENEINSRSKPKIVIIGCGIAGVSAARELVRNGCHDVQILEALERPGGRIHTVLVDNRVVDLGAQFIHGYNVLYDIAKTHDLIQTSKENLKSEQNGEIVKEVRLSSAFDDEFWIFLSSNGEPVSENLIKEMDGVFEKISTEGNQFYGAEDCGTNETFSSYGDYVEKCFNQYMAGCQDDSPDITELKKAFYKWICFWECADNACSSLYNISLSSWGKYVESEGNYNTELKTGFFRILEILMEDLPKGIIHLSKPVTCIKWQNGVDACKEVDVNENSRIMKMKAQGTDDGQHVEVEKHSSEGTYANHHLESKSSENKDTDATGETRTKGSQLNQGPEKGQSSFKDDMTRSKLRSTKPKAIVYCEDGTEYEADHVIVTASLGWLKENHLTLFSPHLPPQKQALIENTGFETVDKVFLEWDEPFWESGYCGYQFLWLDNHAVHVPSAKTPLKTKEGLWWYENCIGFQIVNSLPNFLLGWFTGEQAELMEQVPEDEVRDVCVDLLKHFLKKDIPKPKKLIRTVWNSTKYILGSYSSIRPGTSIRDHDLLGKPLPSAEDPVLLFAGEAYSQHHYSAAHGALENGEDAARTILDIYSK